MRTVPHAERLGTEVEVFGRFVAHPELGALDRELGDNASAVTVQMIGLCRAECGSLKLNGAGTSADREPGAMEVPPEPAFEFIGACFRLFTL
jgi:hypothetical protein